MWTLLTIIVCISIAVRLLKILNSGGRFVGKICPDVRLDGKTVIITGASSGMGKVIAIDLASRGARIICACRNVKEGELVKQEIIEITGNRNVVVQFLDLADFRSVENFSRQIIATESRLDILINNAGIFYPPTKYTKNGHMTEMQVNYLSAFKLTGLLLELLQKSAPSRIINISSTAHRFAQLDVNNLNESKSFFGFFRDFIDYSNSKLCMLLMSNELARRLRDTGVTSNAVHPGFVRTRAHRNSPWVIRWLAKWRPGPEIGAQTAIYLAVSDEVQLITGKYFTNCQTSKTNLPDDSNMGEELWKVTERILNES